MVAYRADGFVGGCKRRKGEGQAGSAAANVQLAFDFAVDIAIDQDTTRIGNAFKSSRDAVGINIALLVNDRVAEIEPAVLRGSVVLWKPTCNRPSRSSVEDHKRSYPLAPQLIDVA